MLNQEIRIKGKTIGMDNPVYVIAEMACAHDGSSEKAEKLIDAAVRAGADAIQFQIFSVKDLFAPSHNLYDFLSRIEFKSKQWEGLFRYAKKFKIALFVCTYDIPSLKLALKYGADAIKLNSSDLSNPDMIQHVASSKKPFTLGTGASTLEEIAKAIDISLNAGGTDIILMHGVQNFPTDIIHANIRRIALLRSTFNAIVGYQDHTDADSPFSRIIDLIAIGAGAQVIEKHITLRRSDKGTDFQAALEPDEFKAFVGDIRLASSASGSRTVKPLAESDKKYREFQKKSIVAAKDLSRGTTITKDKVLFLRCNDTPGLAPIEMYLLMGKKLNRSIKKYDKFQLSDIE